MDTQCRAARCGGGIGSARVPSRPTGLRPEGPRRAEGVRRGPVRGGCAFRGAKLALQPIADVAHVVHGPITCQGHSWDSRPTGSTGPLLYRTAFTTDLGEMDLIFGGEGKLGRAIRAVCAKYDPAAVFVYQTCLPGMIGDDIAAVCRAAAAACGRPVLAVDSPGFSGGMTAGHAAGRRVLLDRVIGTREPEFLTGADVDIIGEYDVAGELGQIEPLLAELGIRVLAAIPGDGRYRDIAAAHRARAAVALCARAMADLAEGLRRKFGIPFIEGSFYGMSNTSRTLAALARLLAERGGPPDLPARTRALTAREEARAWAALAEPRRRLRGKRVLLLAGGIKSWSLADALQEVGLSVVGSSMRKSSERDWRRALGILGPDACLAEGLDSAELYGLLRGTPIDVVLAGSGARYPAALAGVPWVEISHERRHALCGYAGLVRLVRDIDRACASPVIRGLGSRPPWARTAAGGSWRS